jgi:SAM-dependent methyltransferase
MTLTSCLQTVASTLVALLCCAAAAQSPAPALDEEVPFITTPDHVTVAMLEMAAVGARDHVIDLGSGDGRIVITAARRFGASGLGVEIVPDLVQRSLDNARRAGVAARTAFRVQDLFNTDLAAATVVTMYLLPDVNLALRPRLLALAPGTRIVSHDWDLGDWMPDRTRTLAVPDKTIGLEKTSRVHLWVVPARVDGLWCGAAGLSLRLEQRYQAVQALLATGASGSEGRSYSGRVEGRTLRLLGAAGQGWVLVADASGLWVQGPLPGAATEPVAALATGQRLQRAQGTACK